VIVSGHSHTLTPQPVLEEDSVIVQAGSYGEYLGRLDLTWKDGEVTVDAYAAIPIDDTIPGDAAIAAEVEALLPAVDAAAFAPLGLTHDTILAEASMDLRRRAKAEDNLGALVADALRWAAAQVAPDAPPTFSVEADGVIRDDILQGQTGQVAAMDALRASPLGSGPDGQPTYPLVSVYLTAAEVKAALEVNASLVAGGVAGGSFFLSFSGLRFEHDPGAPLLNRVVAVYLGDEVVGYSDTPLDLADETTLYKVVATLYIASMIGSVTSMTGGALQIVPKDESGVPVTDLLTRLVDRDPVGTPDTVEELKTYMALFEFLQSFPDVDSDQVPDLPPLYADPAGPGRQVPVGQ